MGREVSRLNSGIQGYIENCSCFMGLIYRKRPVWKAEKYMIRRIIYLLENAQSLAIARLFYK